LGDLTYAFDVYVIFLFVLSLITISKNLAEIYKKKAAVKVWEQKNAEK
jgi:hypothetical protein